MGKSTVPQSNSTPTRPEAPPLPVLDLTSLTAPPTNPVPLAEPTRPEVSVSSPPSPLEEHEDFYDALDNLFELDEPDYHQPAPPVSNDPTPEGTTANAGMVVLNRSLLFGPPNHPLHASLLSRGLNVPAASPNFTPTTPRLADRVERDFAPQSPPVDDVPRGPAKKAVVVGINHDTYGSEPLRYANRDARCYARSLERLGFPKDNIIILTDRPDQEHQKRPTHFFLMRWINWLLKDAKAGDTLVFFFSGHSAFGPGLATADGNPFTRDQLHHHLVSPVPAGCDLQIIIDCCNASAMIHLQYCVGRMLKPIGTLSPEPSFVERVAAPTNVPEPAPPGSDVPTSPALSPIQPDFTDRHAFDRSLRDLSSVNSAGPSSESTLPPPVTSNNTPPPRRTGGSAAIAAALPSPSPESNVAGTGATTWTNPSGSSVLLVAVSRVSISFVLPTQPTTGEPQRGRQPAAAGPSAPDYFEERKGAFVKPAGRVIFWAASGEKQLGYEAYPFQLKSGVEVRVRNGIVAHAMCAVLDASIGAKLTVRGLWDYLVGVVGEENGWRSERDAKKEVQPDPKNRVQQAELWVSHPEPLSHAAPALDRPLF